MGKHEVSSQIKTALLTTLKQLPMLFWQHMFIAMYLTGDRHVDYLLPLNALILLMMVGLTFGLAYKSERINQHPWLIYTMLPAALGVGIVFDSSWLAQVGLFVFSLYLYARPLKQLFGKPVQDDVTEDKDINSNTERAKDMIPNWLRIKNKQFDDVDISHNTAASITALNLNEFNEFHSIIDHALLVFFLSTLSPQELQKFYDYLEKVIKPECLEDVKKEFAELIQSGQKNDLIAYEEKARATLEVPLCIQEAKFRVWAVTFIPQEFDAVTFHDDDFHESEQELNQIIAGPFAELASGLCEYLKAFQHTYRDDENHRAFAYHLVDRIGGLCIAIEEVFVEEPNKLAPLMWFRESFVENREPDADGVPWKVRKVSPDNFLVKLIRYQLLANSSGIWDGHDYYLLGRIYTVGLQLEWFPINKQQVYEDLQKIMEYVGENEIDKACADAFIALMRDDIPATYSQLSFASLMDLKEHINAWIAKYKPHENKQLAGRSLIITNYLLDMEDLFLENKKQAVQEKLAKRYTLPLAEYIQLFEPLKSAEDLDRAGLWNHAVIIDSSWQKFDGIIRNKQDGYIGWDESTVTADIFDMTQEIPVWFEKMNGECLSVGIPFDLVKLKVIDYDNLKIAPTGLFRLIGYDTYDYSEYLIVDYGSLDDAAEGIRFQLGMLKKENATKLFVYDDQGECVMKENIESQEEKKISKLNTFEDLLKRGNLPDDDRECRTG